MIVNFKKNYCRGKPELINDIPVVIRVRSGCNLLFLLNFVPFSADQNSGCEPSLSDDDIRWPAITSLCKPLQRAVLPGVHLSIPERLASASESDNHVNS